MMTDKHPYLSAATDATARAERLPIGGAWNSPGIGLHAWLDMVDEQLTAIGAPPVDKWPTRMANIMERLRWVRHNTRVLEQVQENGNE